MLKLNGHKITPTVFPDGTSQIWKLDDDLLKEKSFKITWEFENEGELIQLCQLNDLLLYGRVPCPIKLYMPFLPYGRQDKEVSNKTTFALKSFCKVINSLHFDEVSTLDAHSDFAFKHINNFKNISPVSYIKKAILHSESDAIAYPDLGASKRYDIPGYADPILGEKVRDQSTGYITKYSIKGNPFGKNIMIVDDICDGGMTFKLFTKDLLTQGAKSVNLYVTHGIFSKGIQTLKQSGISKIYAGEVK